MTDGAMLLELEGVNFSRDLSTGGRAAILRDISLCLRRGEILALAGPSGGGKSSILRLMNRLEECEGEIRFRGQPLLSLHPVELRRRIALLPQKSVLFDGSVYTNLVQPLRYRRQPLPPEDSPELAALLKRCALEPELLSRSARSLSGGQQQRLCLARALMGEPELLLLDEPTSALDPPNVQRLATVLGQLHKEGLGMVLVSHDLDLVGRLADRVLYLEGGEILAEGSVAELSRWESPGSVAEFFRRHE